MAPRTTPEAKEARKIAAAARSAARRQERTEASNLRIKEARERESARRVTIRERGKTQTERELAAKQAVEHRVGVTQAGRISTQRILAESRERRRQERMAQQVATQNEQRALAGNQRTQRGLLSAGGRLLRNDDTSHQSIGWLPAVLRVTAIVIALAGLYYLVSHGKEGGNAIQRFGYFLNGLTSNQPLFTVTKTAQTPTSNSSAPSVGQNITVIPNASSSGTVSNA